MDPFEQRLTAIILLLGADAEIELAERAVSTLLQYKELLRILKPHTLQVTIYDLDDEQLVDLFYALCQHSLFKDSVKPKARCAPDFRRLAKILEQLYSCVILAKGETIDFGEQEVPEPVLSP